MHRYEISAEKSLYAAAQQLVSLGAVRRADLRRPGRPRPAPRRGRPRPRRPILSHMLIRML